MSNSKINKISKEKIIQLYSSMVKIRRFEEKIIEVYPQQQMRTPVHLYIGEEAIASGVCAALRKDDYVFGTHRSHGLYIAKGGELKKLVSELYGKRNGCCKGKGGSMHIVDVAHGICGTTAIVGGNIPLAVGAGLTIKLKSTQQVSCAFFGDGAVDEGVFYESMNFASLKKLPVIFICENNFYATHSHISKRQAQDNIYTRGVCLGIPGKRVDGNDVIEVYLTAKEAIERARNSYGPTLIECRTYRWRTHVGPQTDEELGMPPAGELLQWLKRCPIQRLRRCILEKGIMDLEEEKELIKLIEEEIEEAFKFAQTSPSPKPEEVFDDVFV
ncbi:MAG: hypothetical protein B6D56_03625 [Candidatus Omnitrophica bacterium 4484_70.1]|nr:MAG: hypothetical protein B6D56_03625 [Candidatus Omnitrophica bacterium 4484_70.1]